MCSFRVKGCPMIGSTKIYLTFWQRGVLSVSEDEIISIQIELSTLEMRLNGPESPRCVTNSSSYLVLKNSFVQDLENHQRNNSDLFNRLRFYIRWIFSGFLQIPNFFISSINPISFRNKIPSESQVFLTIIQGKSWKIYFWYIFFIFSNFSIFPSSTFF